MTLWSFWAQKEQKWEGKSAYGPLLLVGQSTQVLEFMVQ